jgi:hypothetical protein
MTEDPQNLTACKFFGSWTLALLHLFLTSSEIALILPDLIKARVFFLNLLITKVFSCIKFLLYS